MDIVTLRKLSLFKDLSDANLKIVTSTLKTRSFSKGDVLFSEGATGLGVWLVAQGSVKLVKMDATGREQLLKVVQQNEFFSEVVLFDGGAYPATAVASTEGVAVVLYNSDAKALIHAHPELAWHFLHVLSTRLRTAQDRIRILCATDVTSKLAAILLHVARQQNSTVLALGRQDIADMAGVARETVSRILTSFAMQGSIELGRNKISILNQKHLSLVALEND